MFKLAVVGRHRRGQVERTPQPRYYYRAPLGDGWANTDLSVAFAWTCQEI